jgi:transposase
MRGPDPKYPIRLTAEQAERLGGLTRAHTSAQALVLRALIVLTVHEHPEWSNQQIARALATSDRMVRKWRRRWVETQSLADAPRSGAPRRFPPEVRAQATAIACSLPRTQGVSLARWSRAELARQVAASPGLPCVSASTIGRWLHAEKIRPWRYRMWQTIQDPATFLAQARPVLQLYTQASALLQAGTWVVCVDEKTSIQAREAEQLPRPARRGQAPRQAPRYTRRGARHLIASLSVADGQVCGQCQGRKRFVDFQAFVKDVLVPTAQRRGVHTIALILDNGPTHAPKQLERWLREQAARQQWKLTFQVYWLPKNASWLDQIEIWFSVLQRKLLQPNHFISTDDLDQAIMDFIVYGNQTAKPIQWSYTVDKLERKLGMN